MTRLDTTDPYSHLKSLMSFLSLFILGFLIYKKILIESSTLNPNYKIVIFVPVLTSIYAGAISSFTIHPYPLFPKFFLVLKDFGIAFLIYQQFFNSAYSDLIYVLAFINFLMILTYNFKLSNLKIS